MANPLFGCLCFEFDFLKTDPKDKDEGSSGAGRFENPPKEKDEGSARAREPSRSARRPRPSSAPSSKPSSLLLSHLCSSSLEYVGPISFKLWLFRLLVCCR